VEDSRARPQDRQTAGALAARGTVHHDQLYIIGSRQQNDPITFPVEGVDGGSISMLTVRVGGAMR